MESTEITRLQNGHFSTVGGGVTCPTAGVSKKGKHTTSFTSAWRSFDFVVIVALCF